LAIGTLRNTIEPATISEIMEIKDRLLPPRHKLGNAARLDRCMATEEATLLETLVLSDINHVMNTKRI
jgi:hypothetical protein